MNGAGWSVEAPSDEEAFHMRSINSSSHSASCARSGASRRAETRTNPTCCVSSSCPLPSEHVEPRSPSRYCTSTSSSALSYSCLMVIVCVCVLWELFQEPAAAEQASDFVP